jgi:hypothetical protein
MVMGGYSESQVPDGSLNLKGVLLKATAKVYFKKLLENKAELDRVLEGCVMVGPGCSPYVISYKNMLTRLALVHDPLVQAAGVNAWVNTAILYDFNEAKLTEKDQSAYRTMVGALQGGAVCLEQAQLKLYALNRLGIDPESFRYVAENMDNKDGETVGAHAVIVLRVGTTNWVLHNQNPNTTRGEGFDVTALRDMVVANAAMEDAATHINVNNMSALVPDLYQRPAYAMNFNMLDVFTKTDDNDVANYAVRPSAGSKEKPAVTSGANSKAVTYKTNDPAVIAVGMDAARLNYKILNTLTP